MPAAAMLNMANNPAPPLAVSESEVEVLRATARAGTTAQRAQIILRAAEGVANVTIAAELGVSVPTVGAVAEPLLGTRPGRPRRRRMVEAMLYLARTGCQWRYLPERSPRPG